MSERLAMPVSEFAKALGVTRNTVFNWIKNGHIKSMKICGTRLIDMESYYALSRPLEEKKRPDLVYFIEAPETGCIKIGTSRDIARRFKNLGRGLPLELKIIGCIVGNVERERMLHLKFAEFRSRGEWFTATPELRAAIGELLEREGVAPLEEHKERRGTMRGTDAFGGGK